VIEHNVIHNAHAHAITVSQTEATGLIIRNNTLLHNMDTASGGNLYIPAITAASGGVIENNIIPARWDADASHGLIVQYTDPGGANYVGDLFVNGLAGASATLADLRAVDGGLIEQLGVGSSLTWSDSTLQDDTTVVEDDTTVVEDDTTVVEDDTTVVEDDTTVVEDDTTVVEDDTTVVEDDTTPTDRQWRCAAVGRLRWGSARSFRQSQWRHCRERSDVRGQRR
jgi:hypothetical protein